MRAYNLQVALLVAGVVGGAASAPVEAQVEALACPAGEVVVGDLGYTGIECSNCTMLVGSGSNRLWIFRSEPVVLGAKHASLPSAERLQAGDVITSIDGLLITTKQGGRRFANVVPGQPTEVGVRREGRDMTLTITPIASCDSLPYAEPMVDAAPAPAPAKAPRPAAPPTVGVAVDAEPVDVAVPLPPPPPKATSRGRLGFSISCTKCEVHFPDDADAPRWVFTTNPVIERVEVDGPAAAAGLRGGDELTHIDGIPLTDEMGGRQFGAVQPGDTVAFRFVRNARSGEVTIVARERQWVAAVAPRAVAGRVVPRTDAPEPTRFSGVIGGTHIVVSGGPISVTRTETEIVIRSQDITVRINSLEGAPQPK